MSKLLCRFWTLSAALAVYACGGGSNSPAPAPAASSPSAPTQTVINVPTTADQAFNQRRRDLNTRLGMSARLMVGLSGPFEKEVIDQKLTPDISDIYLTGLGPKTSWRGWNSPDGEYLQIRLREAARIGAVPMFTVYQMASSGDSNLSVLTDVEFMRQYWADMHRLVTLLGAYNKPVLLNIEPDFWGYTQRVNTDPSLHYAHVGAVYDECSGLGNTVAAMASCMMLVTKKYAPKALIGFPPSGFLDLKLIQGTILRKVA